MHFKNLLPILEAVKIETKIFYFNCVEFFVNFGIFTVATNTNLLKLTQNFAEFYFFN